MAQFKFSTEIGKTNLFLIDKSKLEGRLDPIFYASDLTKFNSGKFKSLSIGKVAYSFKSGFGAGKKDQTDAESGIIHVRPTNLGKDGLLKFDKNVFVPKNDKADLLEKGDVLFNNTNSQELVGKTSIVTDNKELYYSNHITRIKVNKNLILPEYLWIILNLYQEHKIFYSICTNWNNQSGVGLELLKQLKIPVPEISIQKDIIRKYIDALKEKKIKQEKANSLLESIDSFLLKELNVVLPIRDNSLAKRVFKINFSQLKDNRFDGHYYREEFKSFFTNLEKAKYPVVKLKDISVLITSGITPKSGGDSYTNLEDGIPFIRSGNINIDGDINYNKLLYIKPNIHFKTMKSSQLKFNDLLIAIVGATIGQVGIFKDKREANVNQAIAVVRLKDDINPDYVKEIVKSSIGQMSLDRLKRPVARANLNLEEVSRIKILLPPLDIQNNYIQKIKEIRNNAKNLQIQAENEVVVAKGIIEKLL